MMATACKNCRFYEPRTYQQTEAGVTKIMPYDHGECRRNVPVSGSAFDSYKWPGVLETEWCGEHKPKASDRKRGGRRK